MCTGMINEAMPAAFVPEQRQSSAQAFADPEAVKEGQDIGVVR